MWSRHRLDIGWFDLLTAAWHCFTPRRVETAQVDLERYRSPAGDVLACLSVRSGWDLLLSAKNWSAGAEVLISALTVPDMVRIAEHHGLTAVPLDIDFDTLAPSPEALQRAITPRTKAVVVAHLFGRRLELGPLIEAAHARGLFFVEDCAQAFAGGEYFGDDRADASLFSFGPIKTATALGGALLRIRDESLRDRMRSLQREFPVQSRSAWFRRVLRFAGLKFVSSRCVNGLVMRGCRWFGRSYDDVIGGAVRGFAGEFDISRFRRRPSAALLRLLLRRLRRFSMKRLQRRAELGARLREAISPDVSRPGGAAGHHDYWVFPVLADDPQELAERLQAAGFDTARPTSLCVVELPVDRLDMAPTTAQQLMERVVFVPMYPELSDRALAKLADALT